ncbi:MAG: hypothetical protein ABIA37_02500 [Candidatus Woesearchaeota archaeon]
MSKLIKIISVSLSLAGCGMAHTGTPSYNVTPVRAKQDYSKYPDYKKEIALHNISNILKEVCTESRVAENGFYCKSYGDCLRWGTTYSKYAIVSEGLGTPSRSCLDQKVLENKWFWHEFKAEVDGSRVKFKGKGFTADNYIEANGSQQAEELKEAIEVYQTATEEEAVKTREEEKLKRILQEAIDKEKSEKLDKK